MKTNAVRTKEAKTKAGGLSFLSCAALGLWCALALTGCGAFGGGSADERSRAEIPKETRDDEKEDDDEKNEEKRSEDIAERELTNTEIAYFNDFLNDMGNYGFLLSSYETPENIKWSEVFYNGAGLPNTYLDEAEESLYLEVTGSDELYTDVTRLSARQVENFVYDKTGTDYADAKRPLDWLYIEETDAYYNMHGDTNAQTFVVADGSRQGDTVRLRVEPQDNYAFHDIAYELTLREDHSEYLFVSNRLLWEEGALEGQIFPIEIADVDKECYFVAYPQENNGEDSFVMEIIADNEETCTIFPWKPDEVEDGFTALDAVSFVDYDFDGRTDILAIQTYGNTTFAAVYRGYYETYSDYPYFYMEETLSENLNGFLRDMQSAAKPVSPTIAQVKKLLMEGKKENAFTDWKEAYRYVVRLYEMSAYQDEYSITGYALIYFDGDDVPELITNRQGYVMDMYTFADGRLYKAASEWGYGAGGNHGYEYLPRKNSWYNANADYAGAVYYETFGKMNAEHLLESETELCSEYFDDLNGNGYPDDGEYLENDDKGRHYIIEEKEKEGVRNMTVWDKKEISIKTYDAYRKDYNDYEMIYGEDSFEEMMMKLDGGLG